MKKILILSAALAIAISCKDSVDEKTERALDKSEAALEKGGEAVKKAADKVVDKVKDRLDRNLGCKLVLSEGLAKKGMSAGKFYIENDSVTDNDNRLVVYLITEKDFKGAVNVKVVNKDGVESGRQSVVIDSKAGQAGYHDITFDKRTDIERNSTITIE